MEKKTLKSSFSLRGETQIEIVSDLEPNLKGLKFDIVELPTNKVWASVPRAKIHKGKEFFEPLKEDIAKNGLHWPIMVIECTRQELLGQKAKWGDRINDPPFWMGEDLQAKMYVTWGGSNRLWVARDLGYTHMDCALIPTFDMAHALQKTMRETHMHYYGQ